MGLADSIEEQQRTEAEIRNADITALQNDLFKANQQIDKFEIALQSIVGCGIRYFPSSACHKMKRIAEQALKGGD